MTVYESKTGGPHSRTYPARLSHGQCEVILKLHRQLEQNERNTGSWLMAVFDRPRELRVARDAIRRVAECIAHQRDQERDD